MERYIVVGGDPITCYTGTTSFTDLSIKYSSDSLQDCEKEIPRLFDECGGLTVIIDTKTNEVAKLMSKYKKWYSKAILQSSVPYKPSLRSLSVLRGHLKRALAELTERDAKNKRLKERLRKSNRGFLLESAHQSTIETTVQRKEGLDLRDIDTVIVDGVKYTLALAESIKNRCGQSAIIDGARYFLIPMTKVVK